MIISIEKPFEKHFVRNHLSWASLVSHKLSKASEPRENTFGFSFVLPSKLSSIEEAPKTATAMGNW